jgi:hypothetical protein
LSKRETFTGWAIEKSVQGFHAKGCGKALGCELPIGCVFMAGGCVGHLLGPFRVGLSLEQLGTFPEILVNPLFVNKSPYL